MKIDAKIINLLLLKQVFIGITNMSLDGVPLIAVLNTLLGLHFSLTCFSITVKINILKEVAQKTVLFAIWLNAQRLGAFFYSYTVIRSGENGVLYYNSSALMKEGLGFLK